MNRNFLFAATAVAVLLAVAAVFVWQHVSQLSAQLAALGQQMETLGGQVAVTEQRAEEAASTAVEAERQASEAADRAAEAAEREQQSAEQAEEAEAARSEAEAASERATLARREAERLAEEAAKARAAAEAREQVVVQERDEAIEKVGAAQAEARQAKAEAEAIKARMNEELDRMQRALSRIADTKRTALGLVMNLDSSQIEFDFDKADLRPRNREVLSKVAGVLLTFEDYSVKVFGHTDDVGSAEYNQGLSERRARAVRGYLVEAGVEPGILSMEGLGKSSPLVAGTDPESRQRNRRVEIAIVFSEGDYGTVLPEVPSGE